MTKDEMVGWHPQLNGHEFEQTLGDGEGQGNLACCSPRVCKDSDMTKGLNKTRGHCRRRQGLPPDPVLRPGLKAVPSCSAPLLAFLLPSEEGTDSLWKFLTMC